MSHPDAGLGQVLGLLVNPVKFIQQGYVFVVKCYFFTYGRNYSGDILYMITSCWPALLGFPGKLMLKYPGVLYFVKIMIFRGKPVYGDKIKRRILLLERLCSLDGGDYLVNYKCRAYE